MKNPLSLVEVFHCCRFMWSFHVHWEHVSSIVCRIQCSSALTNKAGLQWKQDGSHTKYSFAQTDGFLWFKESLIRVAQSSIGYIPYTCAIDPVVWPSLQRSNTLSNSKSWIRLVFLCSAICLLASLSGWSRLSLFASNSNLARSRIWSVFPLNFCPYE